MRDSCGTGGQVRHLRVKRPNVAHRLPRGKRATWSGDQHFHKRQSAISQKVFLPNKQSSINRKTNA
ncbi:hypothetical protein [Fictibacillus sp. UD]|uniref:hypothetical protein n=1 Tax=Fictibacillus sp. UD TaxID=3038777 RepID=UPI00374A698F